MAIETVDINKLASKASNIYESVAIVSKRARQVGARTKQELDQKLSYFEEISLETTGEEIFSNEEQARISLDYERRPKPTDTAIHEMMTDQVYFRRPETSA